MIKYVILILQEQFLARADSGFLKGVGDAFGIEGLERGEGPVICYAPGGNFKEK